MCVDMKLETRLFFSIKYVCRYEIGNDWLIDWLIDWLVGV